MDSASQDAPFAIDPDRTTRARIRDAALVRFAADGVAATSLKSIAADAGVSPQLVLHHFGSKEGLRVACDEYVVRQYRQFNRDAADRSLLDPLRGLRKLDQSLPVVRYLARALVDASPHVADLIDELVDSALAQYPEAVERRLMKPTDHPRERIVVLMIWELGMLVLHEHIERLLGVDVIADAEGYLRWGLQAGAILGEGVFEEEFYQQWRQAAQTVLLRGRTEAASRTALEDQDLGGSSGRGVVT